MSALGAAAIGAGIGFAAKTGADYFSNQQSAGTSASLQRQQELYNIFNAYLQQKFYVENLEREFGYQSMLQCQSAGQSQKLAQLNNELSKELNDYNAKRDYNQTLKYIGDSVASYKSALLRNGYNPLLALSSSMPSYAGGAHSAVAATPTVGVGSVSGHSPTMSGVGASLPASNSSMGSVIQEGIRNGFDYARSASEVSANEASAEKDKALAVKALEESKSIVNQRTDVGHKLQSEIAKNYGSVASGVAAGMGTAYGARKVASKVDAYVKAVGEGHGPRVVSNAARGVGESVVEKGSNSAFLGSKMLQSILPMAMISGSTMFGAGASALGAKEASRRAERNGDQRETKWFFPGSMFY